MMKQDNRHQQVLLTSVSTDMEADLLESLLRAEGIPVTRRYQEAGGYLMVYMGTTSFGVDLYVPESMISTAKELLSSQVELANPDEDDAIHRELEEENERYLKKRQKAIMVILWIFFIPGLVYFALRLIQLLFSK